MKATIVITTKNRRDELRVALASCIKQTALPEVLVIDDGSSDGTEDMVRENYPDVRLITQKESRGCIVQRNLGAQLATGDVIFSLDDDAEFSTPYVVEQSLQDFEHESIAAVAIPLIEPNYDERHLQFPPDHEGIWLTDSFKGTAYAILRDAFLEIGGFREDLVHQGEEMDLCIRLLNKDKFVRLGKSDPIIHYESPKRDLRRMHYYGRRNDVLFAMRNAPSSRLPAHLIGTTFNGLRASLKAQQPFSMLQGLCRGWLDSARFHKTRNPVRPKAYKLFRGLRKNPQRLEELTTAPPPDVVSAG